MGLNKYYLLNCKGFRIASVQVVNKKARTMHGMKRNVILYQIRY